MRKKMNKDDKKVKLTISVNPVIGKLLNEEKNISKYIEWVIYNDMKNKNKLNNDFML